MGSAFSDVKDIEKNSYITKFFSEENISPPDPFWNQFLSFSYNPDYSTIENELITNQLLNLISSINSNNFKSRNLIHFINVFLIRSDELKRSLESSDTLSKDPIFMKQIYNGLFIIRCIIKILTENDKLNYYFSDESHEEDSCFIKKLQNTLLSISIEIPINDLTYFVHLESIIILNIIMNFDHSTQKKYLIPDHLFDDECALHSRVFIKTVLGNIIELHTKRSEIRYDQRILANKENPNTGGSLWTYITLGYYVPTTSKTTDVLVDCLSSEIVLLILRLSLNSKNKDCYRKSLFLFCDPSVTDVKSPSIKESSTDSTLEISFSHLLQALSSNFDDEHFVLLFYLFIHRNMNFRSYVLSRENFRNIVLPLVKLIYNYSSDNSNAVYMALIILLIMTENNYFNTSIHREIIDYVDWVKEKTITNMSLGSLIVWNLCRTIQYNFGFVGDRYIHINCLAALANMSSKLLNLHPLASEQIMVLLNILQKRRVFIINSLKTINESEESNKFSNLTNNLSLIEEILQMLVEIINTALIFSLNNNPNMIHTFLYHKKVFPILKDNPNTQSHACNIDAILTYFSSKIEKELGKSVSSQNEVLKIIKKFSPAISKLNNFKRFPELKFKYIEQDSSDEFFIPYIWKLVGAKSLAYFKQRHLEPNNNCKC